MENEQVKEPTLISAEQFMEAAALHKQWHDCNDQGVCLTINDRILETTELSDIDLSFADLRRVEFRGIRFKNVRLDNTSLFNAVFKNCEFVDCSLLQTSMNNVTLSDSRFYDCKLDQTDLSHSVLNATVFTRTKFSLSMWGDAELIDIRFNKCEFDADEFVDAQINTTVFRECHLNHVQFICSRFWCARFDRSTSFGVDFDDTDIRSVQWTGDQPFPVYRMDLGQWPIAIHPETTSIGCQRHANEFWLALDENSGELDDMHDQAYAWWMSYGSLVKAAIRDMQTRFLKYRSQQQKSSAAGDSRKQNP